MEETSCTSRTTRSSAFLLSASSRQTSASFFESIGRELAASARGDKARIWRGDRSPGLHQAPGFLPLLHLMEERAGERRCVLLVSPLLGPLPTRSSRGEDGELDAAPSTPELRAFSLVELLVVIAILAIL